MHGSRAGSQRPDPPPFRWPWALRPLSGNLGGSVHVRRISVGATVKQTDQVPGDPWMKRQSRQLITRGELRSHARFLASLPADHRLGGMKDHVQQPAARSGRRRLRNKCHLGRICGHAGFLEQFTASARHQALALAGGSAGQHPVIQPIMRPVDKQDSVSVHYHDRASDIEESHHPSPPSPGKQDPSATRQSGSHRHGGTSVGSTTVRRNAAVHSITGDLGSSEGVNTSRADRPYLSAPSGIHQCGTQARVHGLVAIQVGELAQANAGKPHPTGNADLYLNALVDRAVTAAGAGGLPR